MRATIASTRDNMPHLASDLMHPPSRPGRRSTPPTAIQRAIHRTMHVDARPLPAVGDAAGSSLRTGHERDTGRGSGGGEPYWSP